MGKKLIHVVVIWLLVSSSATKDGALRCDAPAAVRRSTANITCHFSTDFAQTRKTSGIDRYAEGDTKAIMRCFWPREDSTFPKCIVLKRYSYYMQTARSVTLQISSATEGDVGSYVCLEQLASDQQQSARCNLKLLTAQHTSGTPSTHPPHHGLSWGSNQEYNYSGPLLITKTESFQSVTTKDVDTTYITNPVGSMTSDMQETTEQESEANVTATTHTSTMESGTPAVVVATVSQTLPPGVVPFLYGVDFMVVTSVGIIAITATVIAVSMMCVRKSRRSSVHSNEAAQQLEALRADNHSRDGEINNVDEDQRTSQESNFYWEVRDDHSAPSPELPRPCMFPALPDDYLHPAVARGVMEETDNEATVTPFYENSVLRQVAASGTDDGADSSFAAAAMAGATNTSHLCPFGIRKHAKSSSVTGSDTAVLCAVETSRRFESENGNDEIDEPENGYMPMTGTVRGRPVKSQVSMEVTDTGNSTPLYENYENSSATLKEPTRCLLASKEI